MRWLDSVIADLATVGIRGWRKKSSQQRRLEDSCQWGQNPPRVIEPVEGEEEVVVILLD
jgi:hypothetical protein